MKVAVLGTGAGGRAHAARLVELGHEVILGTRDSQDTLSRTEPDFMGIEPYEQWLADYPGIQLMHFGEAAAAADFVINGIDGAGAVGVLGGIGRQLAGKTLMDYAVPFIYNPEQAHPWPTPWGVMPALDPVDHDSLGERIQRALPAVKVVKACVTQEQETVVDPQSVGGGDHTIFIAGDHDDAKAEVTGLLRSYGWQDILDLGPLVSSRGMEMYSHMHSAIQFALGGARFGIKVVR
ncbi:MULTISPECIES: NADPH-dependent F420 reductase [unclassified Streptomyces]|uniref:NADPH-dependent F420 reductase n=1 Tax=unclassified Streptomyces TaxID=2593676 RepID=UPI00214BF632|nr:MULTISPECIES: NAD(P)-binding domain-containing protein [unclassified Streptomyces]MCX5611843.1 NAD(P)-binding domain-containing protein [Streptomyces sp. NBC_00047]UUU39657.1 NAD(P)-binding domain-containing protein [Streptomyces sp. NBC_00162]